MRRICNIAKWTIIATVMIAAFSHRPAAAYSAGDIYGWVEKELALQEEYPVPEIHIVPRQELREVYREHNANAFKSWSGDYGEKMAHQMMDYYLDNVIGLFIPETRQVLVGSFLAPCRQEAVVAHEMVHYVQVMKDGHIDSRSDDAADRHMFREMQGSKIEEVYFDRFCSDE